jgi:uncharacterized DUF497 family protein
VLVRYSLQDVAFEWDSSKAAANRHNGVDFELACEAFFDPFLRVLDAGSEAGEPRQAILGLTVRWQLLHVVFVERGEVLRIISARPATSPERRFYEDQ